MKKVVPLILGLILTVPAAFAQEGQAASGLSLKDFTSSIREDGITLSLVHLNDGTVDVLFQAPIKFSMKARARQGTLLYVQGVAQKDVALDTVFVAEQNGETVESTLTNIKNFAAGKIPKGQRVDAIIEFKKKLDVTKPFKVKNGKDSVDFKLSASALKVIAGS